MKKENVIKKIDALIKAARNVRGDNYKLWSKGLINNGEYNMICAECTGAERVLEMLRKELK